jgi:hypothetical protein
MGQAYISIRGNDECILNFGQEDLLIDHLEDISID